jgi:hypothetical protein
MIRILGPALLAALLQQGTPARRIEVSADSRILLISTVIWLATDGDFYGKEVDAGYSDAVRSHFADHRGHPAVKRAGAILRRGFAFDAPIGWILHFTPPPELKPRAAPPAEFVKRAPSPETLDEYAAELRDFCRASDFAGFLKKQEAAHAAFIERVRAVLDAEGCVRRLESFYGETRDSYSLTIAPLVGGHNYGPSVGREVYQIFNPTTYKDEASLRRGVTDMVYHEFGHSFGNPVVDAAAPRLEKSAALFEPLRDAMKRQAYGNWMTCMREHVVRACAARLLRGEAGDLKAGRQVAEDVGRGFHYLPPLYRALDEFEKNRAKFKKLADFGPRLFDEIDRIAKEGVESYLARQPFRGRINEAWSISEKHSNLVYVVPSAGSVADYARTILGRIKSKPKVVTDKEALEMKAGESVFVVYGTPASNAFLAKLAPRLPVQVAKEAVIVDGERFEGARRLIAAVPNPDNPGMPLVIYTATDDALIEDINSLYHGPTGFVVGDEKRAIIAQGFLLVR